MISRCGQCKYYRPASPGVGWCHCDSMQVAVVADWEACKNFERRTSMDEDKDKDVPISLMWYEVLSLVKYLSKTYEGAGQAGYCADNKDEEECETT